MSKIEQGYPAKIVLLLPLEQPDLLPAFVEQCLRDRVELIAVVGDNCADVEDQIDDLIVGDGSDPDRFIVTSSHPGEPLDEALNMANVWFAEGENRVEQVQF